MVYIIKSLSLLNTIEKELERAYKPIEAHKELERKVEKLKQLNMVGIIYYKPDDSQVQDIVRQALRDREGSMVDLQTLKENLGGATAFNFVKGQEKKVW